MPREEEKVENHDNSNFFATKHKAFNFHQKRSWALWKDDRSDLTSPVVLHYVEDSIFTSVAWSLSQSAVVYFSDEAGLLQVKNKMCD